MKLPKQSRDITWPLSCFLSTSDHSSVADSRAEIIKRNIFSTPDGVVMEILLVAIILVGKI